MEKLILIFIFLMQFPVFVISQNNSLDFDGDDDYIELNNDSELQLSSGTFEAWVKTSGAGNSFRAIVIKPFATGLFFDKTIL